MEQFEKRAKIMGWTTEQQLYQQKLHLDGTARDIFRILLETERDSFSHAVSALKKIFQPVNIEELHGLKFHHTCKGLRPSSSWYNPTFGTKRFCSITGKAFDRLLNGQFYQALHVKWHDLQRLVKVSMKSMAEPKLWNNRKSSTLQVL